MRWLLKKWWYDLSGIEIIFHVLFWVYLFTSLEIYWQEDWFDKAARIHHPSPISAILFPLCFYLNAFYFIPKWLKRRQWYLYFIYTLGFLVVIEMIRVLVFVVKNPLSDHLGSAIWLEWISNDSIFIGVPNSMFFAFVLSFGYRFAKDWIVQQQEIQQLKQAKLEAELQSIKAHMNPHFLFNSLNALDELIDQSPDKAKTYVHKLSALYRYILEHTQSDWVPLSEEWAFIEDYQYLIYQRFGNAYQIEKPELNGHHRNALIAPTALQGLLENVVKHNQSSPNHPLQIQIKLQERSVTISHQVRPKRNLKSFGIGLTNLSTRYQLLTGENIQIQQSPQFSVTLPLLFGIHESN